MGQKTSQAGLTYDNKNTSQESQGHISAGIMEIFAVSTGMPAIGKNDPREKLSKAYTAAMNSQLVRMNGAVEAGIS